MKSPFKFLDSYTKEDRDIFFGREREIEELYHRVFESKIMLVYGVSGTGKSSLIHCGLANKFQETDWLPLVIRRGGNILENLAAAIKAASITPQTGEIFTPVHFKKAVRSLYLDHYKPVFFIFDQFEELFIFGNKEEKRSFIQVIKTIVESDIQCRFIFVMREEYMASFTEFERFIPAIFQNRVRIEKMSHVNALEAIKGPCKVAGITLEEGFAETLLEKLSPESADVELTYLQVFLDRILKLVDSEHPFFNISLLSQVGNISDLLSGFLDEQIALMEDPDLAMAVLKSFVSAKGTKRPASENETNDNVKSLGRDISSASVIYLIQSFVRLRVLRDMDDHGRYELRHDSLAEKIFEKFSLAEKELLEIRQFIENGFQYYHKRKILLSNDDLVYISNKDSLLNLNPELQEFLKESRKHQHAMQKTLRRLIAISVSAFFILLFIVAYTLIRKSKESQASILSEASIFQYSNPIDQLSLAGLAWKNSRGIQSKEALLKAFNNALRYPSQDSNLNKLRLYYLKEFTQTSSPVEFAACSKDNRYIYGYAGDSVFIWNRDGKIISKFLGGKVPVMNLLMSNNGEYLGGVSEDSILTVWNLTGSILFKQKIRYNYHNLNQIFRFLSSNFTLAISNEHDAVLLDLKGNIVQSLDHHKGSIIAINISNDNKFIATASSDKTIDIWYFNSDKKNYDFYNSLTCHSDTVWSVDFSNDNRHVLSTSADRFVIISTINNIVTWNYYAHYDSIALGYPVNAEFDDSGKGIIIQSFNINTDSRKNYMIALYVDNLYEQVQAGNKSFWADLTRFDYINFSPNSQFFSYSSGNEAFLVDLQSKFKFSNLITNFRLMQLVGRKPFFSSDGKYVFTLKDREIKSWFIDVETISKIAMDYYNIWKISLQ